MTIEQPCECGLIQIDDGVVGDALVSTMRASGSSPASAFATGTMSHAMALLEDHMESNGIVFAQLDI